MEQQLPFQLKILGRTDLADRKYGFSGLAFDKCGFFFCRKGSFEVMLNGREYRIDQGKLFVYMPTCLIRFVRCDEEAEGVTVVFNIDSVIPMVNKVIETEQLFFLRENPYVEMTGAEYQAVSHMAAFMERKLSDMNSRPDNRQERKLALELLRSMAQSLCLEVLNVYFAHHRVIARMPSKQDLVFHHFMLNLFRSYRRQRDVTFYARQQHLSTRYFSSVIKERSGYSASQWIVRLVLAESKYLLETTELSIKEIADQLNFPSQSFFGRYFKQYMGVSPKDYRQEMLEGEKRQVGISVGGAGSL